MAVIDVDSHFEPLILDPDDHPLLKLLRGEMDLEEMPRMAKVAERHPDADDPAKRVEWTEAGPTPMSGCPR